LRLNFLKRDKANLNLKRFWIEHCADVSNFIESKQKYVTLIDISILGIAILKDIKLNSLKRRKVCKNVICICSTFIRYNVSCINNIHLINLKCVLF